MAKTIEGRIEGLERNSGADHVRVFVKTLHQTDPEARAAEQRQIEEEIAAQCDGPYRIIWVAIPFDDSAYPPPIQK